MRCGRRSSESSTKPRACRCGRTDMAVRSKSDDKSQAANQVATTGHEWDGISELNTPLPRWWLWIFYATIVWAVGYWILYPAWPLLSSYTKGVAGWNSRAAVTADLAALQTQRAAMVAQLTAAPLQQIESTPALLDFAR